MKIPYTVYGNNELKNQPETEEDMEIICPCCGQLHKIKYGKNADTGEKTSMLSSYFCPETNKSYLAGVNGKLIIGVKK